MLTALYKVKTTFLAFLILSWQTADCQLACSNTTLPILPNGSFYLSPTASYALYYCNSGYRFEKDPRSAIFISCNFSTGQWSGLQANCILSNPCLSFPCLNNGKCSTFEDPFNTGYTCSCVGLYGGKNCQIYNPCSSCPRQTSSCHITYADDSGRFCYDVTMNLV